MSTFTIRLTTSALNPNSLTLGYQLDVGAPSFVDIIVTNSLDTAMVPNGIYDGYCLNPISIIYPSPTTYEAQSYAGNAVASFQAVGLNALTLTQVNQLNWLLTQNFTSDPKYSGQFNYGEVQTAIWKIIGFTDEQIASEQIYLTDNNRQVVSKSDFEFLISASQSAVANNVLPSDAFFTMVIDPAGDAQPLISMVRAAELGNYVWSDANADGIQNNGEVGLSDVSVYLWRDLNSDGKFDQITETLNQTVTDSSGYYNFKGLAPGFNYQVYFAPKDGYVFSPANIGDDGADSDVDKDGLSQVITLAAGESNQTIDAGLIGRSQQNSTPASLSGFVYQDEGNDGAWDGVAAGIENVVVTLLDASGNPVLDASNNPITATTNGNGFYTFNDLKPGTYGVSEAQPTGYLDGKDTAGEFGGGTAGNDIITGIVLAEGQNSLNNNFGELKPASVSGFVYIDNSDDGIKDGNESSISGVTVTLTGTDDLGVIAPISVQTDENGKYSFDDLRPGTYTVKETQPTDYLDGKDKAGAPGGGVAGNDVINTIVLNSSDSSTNNNFGELPQPAQLSGFVYVDAGDDGTKGDDETAIGGVTVTLLDVDGNTVATATTDDVGYYEF
ncbi:SdrD B-like domain-containing protein, partial [Chromatium okenii]